MRIRVSNPGTDAGPDLTVCNGDSAILGGFLGDTTNFKYTWRPSFQLNDSTLANPTAHITTDTTYTLKMVDQDRGCVRRDTMQVQTGPTEAIAFPDSLKFCSGGTERLYAAGGTRFTWQPDKFLDCNNCRTTLTTPTDSINYNVIVNSGSCQDTTNIHVEVHPLPRVDAGTDSFLLCSPDTITLGGAPTVTGGSKPYSIQWFPLAGLNNPTDSQPKAYPDQGKQYNLTVTDNNGCQAFDSTVVLVSAAPPAQAPPDTQIYIGQYIRLSTPEGGYNYQWQPDASLDSPSIASPLARPLENTTYTVTVDSNNCTSTSAITIKVTDKFDIFVPDAFTPNGDGINDRLIIRGVGIAKVIKFQIYNRWGRPVYTAQSVSKAMQKGWDGRHNGTPVSAGNYTYHLIVEDFDGNRTTKSGAISIIR